MQTFTAVSLFALLASAVAGAQLDAVDTLETHWPEQDSVVDPIDTECAHYVPPCVVFMSVSCVRSLRAARLPGFSRKAPRAHTAVFMISSIRHVILHNC